MKRAWGLAVWVLVLALGWRGWAQSGETLVRALELSAGAFQEVRFTLASAPAADAEVYWLVHVLDGEGDLPYDGCFERGWQRLRPGQLEYRHAFPVFFGAARVELKFRSRGGGVPAVSAVSVAAVQPAQLVLNGDFALGAENYSGWSDFYEAGLQENEGKTQLLVRQNGYALSDFFPVAGGGGYDLVKGAKSWPGVTILAYDRDRHFMAPVSRNHRQKPPIRMPDGAAYGRMLFETSHDHIPDFCRNLIEFTGLQAAAETAAAVLAEPSPAHPGLEIVLLPGSVPQEEQAARELQYWIGQISGRVPRLLARPSAADRVRVRVGHGQAGAFGDDLAWLRGSDGYAVRRRGGEIYLFGGGPRGVLYGVYALLEQNSDIIWPRPNPQFEAVYSRDSAFELRQADFRSRPAFRYREISRGEYGVQGKGYLFQNWQGRNGLNTHLPLHVGFNYPVWVQGATLGYSGSHLGWIGEELKGDENFKPLIDGVRDSSRWRQPCYAYEKTAQAIEHGIRKKLALLPGKEMEYIMCTLSDNWSVCACPACMQPIPLADGTLLHPQSPYSVKDPLFFSTRNFMMLNRVAEGLARDYPELRIMTHAYIFAAEPPRVPVHPAIIPQYAAYPTKNERYPILSGRGLQISGYDEGVWARRFKAWSEWKPDGLGFFGYYYTAGFNVLADTAAADYRALADFGGVQAHTEGYPLDGEELSAWDMDGMEKWVIARLMWDPRQDVAALREHYLTRVYGEAAGPMRQFQALLAAVWHDTDPTFFVNCHAAEAPLFEGMFVKSGREEEARGLLQQGLAAAVRPQGREMIRRTLAKFDALRGSLGRHVVPLVEESRHDWSDAVSPQWEKGLEFKNFYKVSDWRPYAKETPAEQATQVRLMHDGERLYIRVLSDDSQPEGVVVSSPGGAERFPQGDRFELILGEKGRRYVAVGPNGNRYARPGLNGWECRVQGRDGGWVALLSIPLSELSVVPGGPKLAVRFGRVYRLRGDEREESTFNGASLYNNHASFWAHLQLQEK